MKGTLSGVGECEQVRISPADTHLLIKLWFRSDSTGFCCIYFPTHTLLIVCMFRKADSVTVSPTHVETRVTPVRTDTSCCRRSSILVVKVRHPPQLNLSCHISLTPYSHGFRWSSTCGWSGEKTNSPTPAERQNEMCTMISCYGGVVLFTNNGIKYVELNYFLSIISCNH